MRWRSPEEDIDAAAVNCGCLLNRLHAPLARHVEDLPQPTRNETQTTPSGTTLASQSGDLDKDKDPPVVDTAKPVLEPVEAVPRRSRRSRRPPEWHKDYQMTDS